jgi:hypothetical protein
MSRAGRRVVSWLPRVLGIAFAIFISMFALDVFSEGTGFWRTAFALIIHLIPAAIVVVALAVGWRREWAGAILFGVLGMFYLVTTLQHPDWILVISGPLFLIALLFLMSWLANSRLRAGH